MEITTNSRQQVQTSSLQEGKQGQAKAAAALSSEQAKAAPKVEKVEPADIDAAMAEIRSFVEGLGRDLSFKRDEALEKSIITVFDSNTKEVIRQIPSEEVVAIARQIKSDLDELRSGLLINGKA